MNHYFKYLEYVHDKSEYYSRPQGTAKASEEFSVKNLAADWVVDKSDSFWTMHYPIDEKLLVQGWKIHVSTVYDNADTTLEIVSKILFELNIAFKHVNGKNSLFYMYSKHGNRVSAGKFITIYPGQDEFIPLLDKLHDALSELPKGPYILTDRQWKDGNVYYRYGAFRKLINEDGVACLYNLDGELIPDERKPKYHLPDFVTEPSELRASIKQENTTTTPNAGNRLSMYKIEKVIRFSNAGGIYLATRLSDDKKCVVKEARMQIGLDSNGKNATERLNIEFEALKKLEGIDGVVNLLDYFSVWESTFLIEEFVEGTTLASWIASNYPYSINSDTNKYFNSVFSLMARLKKIVNDMHQRDVAMCDLQPQNIIIGTDLDVKIIDFEAAESAKVESFMVMGAKGFYHPLNKTTTDRDWYSLNRILQMCLLPVGAVYDIDISLNKTHCKWIYEHFGESAYAHFHEFQMDCSANISKFENIFANTYAEAKNEIERGNKKDVYNIQYVEDALIKGLIANCDTSSESLINGDIRQFEMDCGMLNLQNGGFGAVLTLLRTHGVSRDVKIWVDNQISKLQKVKYNNGFLTGRSGIACVLYECGYESEALELLDIVISEYDRDTKDLSLRSGLSGIGIALVGVYNLTKNCKYLAEAEAIFDIIVRVTYTNQPTGTDWDSVSLGLLDGYSGISLFASLLYGITGDKKHLEVSIKAIQREIDSSRTPERDGVLQLYDEQKNRLLPYFSNGTIGLGLAVDVLNKVSKESFFEDEMQAISKVTDFRVVAEPGLFDGIGGFFMLGSFQAYKGSLDKPMDILHLFLVKKEDTFTLPAKMFYKVSFDIHSGVAGVLLALASAKNKNSLSWLPMAHAFSAISCQSQKALAEAV